MEHSNAQKPKRVEWLDIAKGIGILLVVLGHSGPPAKISWWIWSFHMPLFFVISGVLFSIDKYPSFSVLFTKRNSGLIRPYFFFVFISLLVEYSLNSTFGIVSVLLHGSGLALWFIPVLYLTELLYYCLRRYLNDLLLVGCLIALSVLGFYLTILHVRFPYNAQAVFTAIAFYGFGNLGSQKLKLFLRDISGIRTLFSLIAFIGINLVFCFLNHGRFDLFKNEMGNFLYVYLSALAGCMFVFLLSNALDHTNLAFSGFCKKIFVYLGMNTLVILGMHQVIKLALVKVFIELNIKGVYSLLGRQLLLWVFLVVFIYLFNNYLPYFIGKGKASTKTKPKKMNAGNSSALT